MNEKIAGQSYDKSKKTQKIHQTIFILKEH